MEKQHLTYFKIENFKRFDSLEMSNLGQFNLIVGDNNVGKTSVLEGLCFDENLLTFAKNYFGVVNYRKTIKLHPNELKSKDIEDTKFWEWIFQNTSKPILLILKGYINTTLKLSIKSVSVLNKQESVTAKYIAQSKALPFPIKLWLVLADHHRKERDTLQMMGAYFEDIGLNADGVILPYVPVNFGYEDDLVQYFYTHFNANKEARKELEENLRFFIKNIEEIRVHKFSPTRETLGVTLTDSNSIFPLTQYGDGTVKTVRILLEIPTAQGKRLMVDEIGAGIHFTRLKDYWKTIIQLCAKYNVQLFATTHSLECQQAYIEALEDPEMQQYQKDARNISLIENKQGEVEAITFDFEQFEYALNIGFNTRGGKA